MALVETPTIPLPDIPASNTALLTHKLPTDSEPTKLVSVGQIVGLLSAATIAEMKNAQTRDGMMLSVGGFYARGDGGGGVFQYDAASIETSDNGTIFTPNSGVGRWKRVYQKGIFCVEWFGAKFDGVTDDAAAIDATTQKCYATGGGRVLLPPGIGLLGTISAVSGSQYSYIVPKNGVDIIGAGMGATRLKVKDGENTRFESLNGPNVITTNQAGPLTDCRFADFTVDWNGANNLLTNTMEARQNCAIFSLHGGTRILIERVRVVSTPGNQCFFFPSTSNNGNGDITVRNCKFENNGSGLPGNYNLDHSSVYLNGPRCAIENCTFINAQLQAGAAFELHGSNSHATGCYTYNVQQGFWLASDYEATNSLTVSYSTFENCSSAFAYSCPTYAINSVHVSHCRFVQLATANYNAGGTFVLPIPPDTVSDRFVFDNNEVAGASRPNCRLMFLNLLRDVSITNNRFSGFVALGIWFGGGDLGNGNTINSFSVCKNYFTEVAQPVYHNAPAKNIGDMLVCENTMSLAAANGLLAVTIVALNTSVGRIVNNQISPNYNSGTGGVQALLPNVYVQNYAEGTYVPVVNGSAAAGVGTYTTQKGQFTKHGNQVFFQIALVWTAHTGTGGILITLPTGDFAPSADANVIFYPATIYSESIALTAAKIPVANIVAAGPYIGMYEFGSAGPNLLAMSNAGTLVISGSYVCKK